jgi:CrcB protein
VQRVLLRAGPSSTQTDRVNLVYVAVGGAIGSSARYLLGGFVHRHTSPYFPYGTFAVNVVGCFAFGVVAALAEHRAAVTPAARTFLLIGVLGGFTTFSSFTYETFALVRDAEFLRALVNVAGQVVVGFAALWAGYAVVRIL